MKYPNMMSSCAIALIVFSFSQFPVIESVHCPHNGWFGDHRDQFQCHCKSGATCDTERDFDDAWCERGWFGPQCQYSDLASEARGFTVLIDGNTSTCISVTSSPSQWLTFGPPFRFTWMRLVGDNAQSLKKLELEFWTSGSNSQNLDASLVKLRVNNTVVDVHGQFNERIQKIIFRSSDGLVRLCSVHVSGGRNVALKQPTSQSSTYFGYTQASRAVDGNMTGDWRMCTYTGVKDNYGTPTWTLTISSPTVDIDRYRIYHRDDRYQCHLKYFQLREFYSGNTIRTHTDTQTVPTRLYGVRYSAAKQVDSVTIAVSKSFFPKGVTQQCSWKNDLILQLCEVEAFGDSVCPSNKWGRQCEKSCNCQNSTEKCYVSTGMCPSGCKAGYHGIGCDKVCPEGRYGPSCTQTCSDKCLGGKSQCDKTDGKCLSGCQPGYHSDQCDQECDDGTYGQGCNEMCSQNCSDKKCDHVNGSCNSCVSGYEGTFCENECPEGRFGSNCQSNCSDSCLNNTCYHVTGQCDGCIDGRKGLFCEMKCSPKFYGEGCTQSCSVNCKEDLNLLPAVCHHESGQCFLGCKDGYVGPRCEDECNAKFYGEGCTKACSVNCKEDLNLLPAVCHHESGQCFLGCKDGFVGPRCEDACNPKFYGEGCTQACSVNCKADLNLLPAVCHHESGQCFLGCKDGFVGPRCVEACNTKFYGKGCTQACSVNCKEDLNLLPAVCHPESGQCFLGCKDGFFGPRCMDECPEGSFGATCQSLCSESCLHNKCHHVTGQCDGCIDGLKGDFCDTKCDKDTYGSACKRKCSSICPNQECHHFNGFCKSCPTGFKGKFCEQEIPLCQALTCEKKQSEFWIPPLTLDNVV